MPCFFPVLWVVSLLLHPAFSQHSGFGLLASYATEEATPFSADLICSFASGINSAQRDVCRQSPQSMSVLHSAVSVFQTECQHQFKNERWNCTGSIPPFFGDTSAELRRATKENAFVHSLTSATAVHSLTLACSEGRINGCTSCDTRLNGHRTLQGQEWGGCSHNVDYGVRFARDFLDARETEGLENKTKKDLGLALANIHNNRAGRMAVQNNMRVRCRCHGVSASCTLQTCWREVPSMREVSTVLKRQYNEALRVSVQRRDIGPAILRTVNSKSVIVTPQSSDLVYLKRSINYCIRNRNFTFGRECAPRLLLELSKNGSTLPGGIINEDAPACEVICCGQLHRMHRRVFSSRCHCRFVWCCDIRCDICSITADNYYCTS